MESKSKRPIIYACLIAAFIVIRIAVLQEPWNSDDIRYFDMARLLNSGEHVIQRDTLPERIFHADLRFGLLVPIAFLMRISGDNMITYYLLPLLFSVAGFVLMMKITEEVLSWRATVILAILHIVYPFEIRHGSVLLTDLPAAVLTLLYIYYIYKNPVINFEPKKFCWHAFVGSLLMFWPYLMRDNQPAILFPALVVLFFYRPYRLTVSASLVFFFGWVLLEQWFYVSKGVPIGFRWKMLIIGQQVYKQFLATYSFSQYLLRSFRFIAVDIGWVGLVFFVCAIISHIHGFFISKNPLVRACLAVGLVSYVLFAFYVYGMQNGRLVVMTSAHRFIQLFYYTSILAVGVSLTHLAPWFRARLPNNKTLGLASVSIFALTVGSFGVAAYAHAGRFWSGNNDLLATLRALDAERINQAQGPITLTGTDHSLRVMRLLPKTIGGHALDYRILSHQAVLDGLMKGDIEWFLVDKKREELDLRYVETATAFHELLDFSPKPHDDRRIEEEDRTRKSFLGVMNGGAKNNYRLIFQGRSFQLYRRTTSPTAAL
jgi:hypothetical protein